MIKFGIHSKAQLTPDRLYGPSGSRRFVALDLYEAYEGGDEQDTALFQERVINRLAMANGSFKRTHLNRFEAFDREMFHIIDEKFPQEYPLAVHDIAVSDGRTTVPFFKKLKEMYGENLSFLASDYAPYFQVIQKKDDPRRIIRDKEGNLIQFIVPPFVFNVTSPESRKFYPLNFAIRKFLEKTFVPKMIHEFESHPENFNVQDMVLLCRPCKKLKEEEDQFSFEQYNLLSGPKGQFQVIRAMNILNPGYFAPDKMTQIIRHIKDSLVEGGVLITGSNTDSGTPVNGGIYQVSKGRFIPLSESGGGSPVKTFLL